MIKKIEDYGLYDDLLQKKLERKRFLTKNKIFK